MLATVIIVFFILLGAGVLGAAFIMTRRARLSVEARVRMVAKERPSRSRKDTVNGKLEILGQWLDTYMRRVFAFGIAHSWGMTTGPKKLLVVASISAALTWLLIGRLLDFSITIVAPCCLFMAFLVPNMVLRREQKSAERQFTELFPDAVDTVVRMLRAGLPATSAIRTVGEETRAPVGPVFRKIADQMRIGITLGEALNSSSQQIAIPDFRFFAVAINLQYATGGNLVFTLDTLSQIIRKRRAVRNKAKAVTSEIRMSAYVLGSLPFLTMGALLAIQPDYLMPLFVDRRGHYILGMVAGGLLLSIITMKTMMNSVTDG